MKTILTIMLVFMVSVSKAQSIPDSLKKYDEIYKYYSLKDDDFNRDIAESKYYHWFGRDLARQDSIRNTTKLIKLDSLKVVLEKRYKIKLKWCKCPVYPC